MRTYEAINIVSKSIIEDKLCEAVLIKGSIGRGDDDEFSDVDMYAVVKEADMELFLSRRIEYLESYLPLVYTEQVYFVAEQIVAIYDDGLHFDLYTVTESTLPHLDKAKVIYDPAGKFENYVSEIKETTPDQLCALFHDALYYFVEADGAYNRKNYPWAASILRSSISASAVLLRFLYDKDHAYLGLKKINEIIPAKQFHWLCTASDNLSEDGFATANSYIIKMLEFVIDHIDEGIKSQFNLRFFDWVKEGLGTRLFVK